MGRYCFKVVASYKISECGLRKVSHSMIIVDEPSLAAARRTADRLVTKAYSLVKDQPGFKVRLTQRKHF